MATKIRLARGGAKKRPYYRLVVADVRAPRDGRYIEKIGTYNPLLAKDDPQRVTLKEDRVNYWLGTGATPTDRVAGFFEAAGITLPSAVVKKREQAKKNIKIAEEKRKIEAEKKKAEEAKAAKEAEAEASPAEEAPAEDAAPAEEAATE